MLRPLDRDHDFERIEITLPSTDIEVSKMSGEVFRDDTYLYLQDGRWAIVLADCGGHDAIGVDIKELFDWLLKHKHVWE